MTTKRPTVTAADIDALVAEAAERRGRDRVWKLVGGAAWAIGMIVLGYTLNHYSAKRSEETQQLHVRETARVTEKLQRVEEATKALAPVEQFSKMMSK
jgi:hypothetical protein